MTSYFIYLDGKQQGPFRVAELKAMAIAADTPVWYNDAWRPASSIDELRELFPGSVASGERKAESVPKKPLAIKKIGLIIAILLAVAFIAGAVLWNKKTTQNEVAVSKEEQIKQIKERELQKAIEERRTIRTQEQEAKKKEAELKDLKRKKNAELQSLQSQLNNAYAQYDDEEWELERIRRKPRIFKSRAEKAAEIDGQIRVLQSLENKIAGIKSRINKTNKELKELSKKP